MTDYSLQLNELETGPVYSFRDWPNPAIPPAVAGVYTIWGAQHRLIYVGMAGRGNSLLTASPGRVTGLFSRLASHASGRRSGDQFCVYVGDRLVLKELQPSQINLIAAGQLSLDGLIRAHIREELSYRFVITVTGQAALAIEKIVRGGGLQAGQPLLNPLTSRNTH